MVKGGYEINDMYQGGTSSFSTNSYSAFSPSYQFNTEDIGLATDARTADILTEVSKKLSSGAKSAELTQVSSEVFEAIPKQHFKELAQLLKLVGAEASLHAPVVEASGITQQGWSNSNRERAERQIVNALEKAHDMNPEGNTVVTFHSSAGLPGSEFKIGDKGNLIPTKMAVIERESGKMTLAEEEKKYYPNHEGIETKQTAQEVLDSINNTKWDNSLSSVLTAKESADRILQETGIEARFLYKRFMTEGRDINKFNPVEQDLIRRMQNANEFIHHSNLTAKSLFSEAYKYAQNDKEKEKLTDLAKEYQKNSGIFYPDNAEKLSQEELIQIRYNNDKNMLDLKKQSEALNSLVQGLRDVQPELYQSVDKFAIENSKKTFANAAIKAYSEFKDKAPIISIENPPATMGLSTGEDIAKIVEASREEFVNKAILSKKEGGLGMSKGQAENQAKKLIGATLDVGHINMLRGQGFEKEQILHQTKQFMPYLKHVHLSDNFGLEHTELPMGMGNVPMKEITEQLGKEGYEGKKVVEAINWWQHFSNNGANPPLRPTLEAMGGSFYSQGSGPFWYQSPGLYQGYYGGYGMMLPQGHFQKYGAGFSQLPMDFGGNMPGTQGTGTSGRPME